MPNLSALVVSGSGPGAHLSSLTVSGAGATGNLATGSARLPLFTSSGFGVLGGVGAGEGTLPLLTSSGYGAQIINRLPLSGLTASGRGLTGIVGAGAARLAVLTASGAGTVGILGVADLQLSALRASGAGVLSVLATGSAALPLLRSTGEASVGIGGVARATIAALRISGRGAMTVIGTGLANLPLLTAEGRAIMDALDISLIVAMNAGNAAVTEYDGWDFNSFARYNGRVIAAGAAGIVVLGGERDNTATIAAHVTTGQSDFGSDELKRLTDFYSSYRSAGAMRLTVTAKVNKVTASYSYPLPTTRDELESHKSEVGRGFEDRYYQFGMANVAGSNFSIDTLTALAQLSGRRA